MAPFWDANAAFSRITGYSLAEVQGANPHLFSSGKHHQAFYASMWASLRDHGHWRGEIWNRRKRRFVRRHAHHQRRARHAGASRDYVGLSTDITPLKEHASQL